ncbi:DUF3617 domain-containing protein [Novosphingobium jiangmenense]|uniref:DUF3617 family protein n=1 Tax=Novosphingobium jiangmenense TaxID=2791981 RepID=A0ABS0HDT7_9SPHN|nr:hypothetical protein [Novosphingobium jiangmenense]MBF9150435.1 hypothetical protein [Novosphingobium jiangmenense]
MSSRLISARGLVRAIGLSALAGGAFLATSGVAQGPALAMLDRLEPGLWEVRARDEADTVQVCVDNGRKLIQVRHRGEACRRFVIEDAPTMVTVQYTCPAGGYGHTRVRFENPRLAQLETQGIDKGLPFNFIAEARRLGPCPR